MVDPSRPTRVDESPGRPSITRMPALFPRSIAPWTLGLSLLTCAFTSGAFAADLAPLWQIGTSDNLDGEFALAPQSYQSFKDDGFFVVGQSNPKTDWPYVHPGPADGWAGSRTHPFLIEFHLKSAGNAGECRLVVDFLDTQGSSPPRFRADINGQRFEHSLPAGAGDASVNGDPARGREHVWEVPFPASLLRAGRNEITLTTLSGSWALYDAVRLESPAGIELLADPSTSGTHLTRVESPSVWLRRGEGAVQPIEVTLRHVGPETTAVLLLDGRESGRIKISKPGFHKISLDAPALDQSHAHTLTLVAAGKPVETNQITIVPPKIRDIWVLPHSHVDVGYTDQQEQIVRVQIQNLEKSMELARASATNPPGMRFKWNPEAIWSLDHFLQQATPEGRNAFLESVRRGDVGVDALYGNMLTGLCRPEELAQCLAFGPKFAALTGRPVESAAICDVPGWTWGIVPVMAQAGVKYFAIGPNQSARIGSIHQWDNRPFYWKSQAGLDRVLCWVVDNYHHLGDLEQNVLAHAKALNSGPFPYDTSFIYWVGAWPDGGVDNAPPDTQLADKVVQWNRRYVAPRVTIGLAGDFFRDFERRHGSRVPEFSGDLTPYWEDGAGSTSRETGLNRASAERINQAETLFAMLSPTTRPAAKIDSAWKNTLLYSEHTWGAHNSISQPDIPFVTNQWRVKQGFALDADKLSREILDAALRAPAPSADASPAKAIDVFNTTQWTRTDLVRVPAEIASPSFKGVTDDRGTALPSQLLASGELAFLARDIPPFSGIRFRLVAQPPAPMTGARLDGPRLVTSQLVVDIDEKSGAVRRLSRTGLDHSFVDPAAPVGLNDYRYVLGTNTAAAQANGPVRFRAIDAGPLVITLGIDSDAPGCKSLTREVQAVEGLGHVDFVNHVDRLAVRAKDSVHFGFAFNVPGATTRMETPWAVVRPNIDQLPGSCRNWFTVQRWVDLSSNDRGITWMPIDAPLVELGAMTANLMGEVRMSEWLDKTLESTTLYSWAQNNHWFTNYKADQPGETVFRYRIRPHSGGYSPADAARHGIESTRPLLVTQARSSTPPTTPRLTLSSPDVIVETLKVSEDGHALVARLFGVSGATHRITLDWGAAKPRSVSRTDLSEKALEPLGREIEVPAYGIVSVRAEQP